jgi:hypothetical protein
MVLLARATLIGVNNRKVHRCSASRAARRPELPNMASVGVWSYFDLAPKDWPRLTIFPSPDTPQRKREQTFCSFLAGNPFAAWVPILAMIMVGSSFIGRLYSPTYLFAPGSLTTAARLWLSSVSNVDAATLDNIDKSITVAIRAEQFVFATQGASTVALLLACGYLVVNWTLLARATQLL